MTRFLGSRRGLLNSAGASYDPNAAAYFSAAGITNPIEKTAVNTFIINMKASGIWVKKFRIFLVSPTSADAALYCCKTLSQMSNTDALFDPSGWIFNGATSYLDTNFIPQGSGMTPTDENYTAYLLQASYSSQSSPFGVKSGDDEIVYFYFDIDGFDMPLDVAQIPDKNSVLNKEEVDFNNLKGTYAIETLSTFVQEIIYIYKNGTELANDRFTFTATSVPLDSVYLGAVNDGGPRSLFIGTISYFSMGLTLGPSLCALEHQYVNAYQRALGRDLV